MVAPALTTRPPFIDRLSQAHANECKNVVLLTGNILDTYPSPTLDAYTGLERGLYQELKKGYTVVRLDLSTGIEFFDDKDEAELLRVVALGNISAMSAQALPEGDNMRKKIAETQYRPLEALILLRSIEDAYFRASRAPDAKIKPLCVLIQFAGSFFPSGEFDRLQTMEKQQIVSFLSWANSPRFTESDNLIVLLSSTKAEVNARIAELPTTAHVQIDLPKESDRTLFLDRFEAKSKKPLVFELERPQFLGLTTGLKLTQVNSMLESAARTGRPITRTDTMEQVKDAVKALLGDVAEVKRPTHGPKDIFGYEQHGAKWRSLFERASDRKKAPQVVLISGPNGGGKTYQLEAYAGDSGWVVLVIKGVRSMWYGETDRLFEVLRFIVDCFGKCVIVFDEAHTKFANIHSSNGHDTEIRLTGNWTEMMSDKSLLGKVFFVLATSRPDLLNPDMRSRASIQIPIADLEGEERQAFVQKLYVPDGLVVEPSELSLFIERTQNYSARDYFNLGQESRALNLSLVQTLNEWQAPTSLVEERRYQSLIAAQHCSYPKLLPGYLSKMKPDEIAAEIAELKLKLRY